MASEAFPFDLDVVLKKLSLPSDSVLNVYLLGSRLWGTQTSQSDYDLVVVMREWAAPKPETVHNGLFDARVLSKEGFVAKLAENELESLKCCWLPAPHILREAIPAQKLLETEAGGVDRARLRAGIMERTEKDLAKAAKFLEKGKRVEGGKILLHAIRLQLLGGQILQTGRITDFGVLTEMLEERGLDRHHLDIPGVRQLLQEAQSQFRAI